MLAISVLGPWGRVISALALERAVSPSSAVVTTLCALPRRGVRVISTMLPSGMPLASTSTLTGLAMSAGSAMSAMPVGLAAR